MKLFACSLQLLTIFVICDPWLILGRLGVWISRDRCSLLATTKRSSSMKSPIIWMDQLSMDQLRLSINFYAHILYLGTYSISRYIYVYLGTYTYIQVHIRTYRSIESNPAKLETSRTVTFPLRLVFYDQALIFLEPTKFFLFITRFVKYILRKIGLPTYLALCRVNYLHKDPLTKNLHR